jgi:hypothetical protein
MLKGEGGKGKGEKTAVGRWQIEENSINKTQNLKPNTLLHAFQLFQKIACKGVHSGECEPLFTKIF